MFLQDFTQWPFWILKWGDLTFSCQNSMCFLLITVKIKNGRRISKVQQYPEERKGGVWKTTSKRGRYLIVFFISLKISKIEWNKCWNFVTVLSNFSMVSLPNFCKAIFPIILFIILQTWLQGLDPNLQWGEAALALYEKEVGPKPEKVCHFGFFFLEHVFSENLE